MPRLAPWTNPALRLGIPLLFLGTCAALATPMIWVRSPFGTGQHRPLAQPVQFDHRHHVTQYQIDCLYCHAGATRAATAGVPATEVCMGCHVQVWSTAPILEPVRDSWRRGTPLVWRRVNSLPGFVYLDHSIHLAKGIGCSSCHGPVGEMGRVYQKEPLTMGWCIACHRQPTPNVRPRSELTVTVWRPPAGAEAAQRALAEEYRVRSLLYCTACHR